MRGTIRNIGVEGGVWALVTDDGQTVELIDPPRELRSDGVRASIVADRKNADVSIGMLGDAVRVESFEILDE